MVQPIGVGLGPRDRIAERSRQDALDASARLQVCRTHMARALADGAPVDATIVGRGDGIETWMAETAPVWRELLSVRPAATVAQLRASLPTNRVLLDGGLRMTSLFHHDGLDAAARLLVATEPVGSYRFGFAPVQMKLVDRRYVLLQGPDLDGDDTVMAVRSAACLDAAWTYWRAALASSYPATEEAPVAGDLTDRQQRVATLLATDTRDDSIAATLGVSVRTVRAEIAAVLLKLGVRTRFAAGVRLRRLVDTDETTGPAPRWR